MSTTSKAPKPSAGKRRLRPTATIAVLAALFAGAGLCFYLWLLVARFDDGRNLAAWSALGTAVGPFAVVLSALALFAAVLSVAYQQQELRLTRKEMAAQRREMQRQRAQFERAARAQEKLADAQQRQAQAQEESNRIAWSAEYGRCRATVAQLYAAQAAVAVLLPKVPPVTTAIHDLAKNINIRLAHEMEVIAAVTHLVTKAGQQSNMPGPPQGEGP